MLKMRLTAILLAVIVLGCTISGCNLVVKNVERDRATVVATVDDLQITKGELDDMFNAEMLSYGIDPAEILADTTMTEAINDYRLTLLDKLVDQTVMKLQAEKMGFTLTEEEKANARAEAQLNMDSLRETLSTQFAQEADYPTLTAEERETELESRYQQVLQQQGMDLDGLAATIELSTINDRMLRQVKGDVTVSEELLKQRYDTMVAEQKEAFTADPGEYETTMNNYEIAAWQPAGFRRAKHILLKLGEAEQKSIDDFVKLGQTEEAEEAQSMAMDILLLKAQEVKRQLDAGVPFDQLVEEKNEDTGMKDPVAKRRGYLLRKESSMAAEFIEAVFNMDTVGAYTDPVKTQFGYHIIQLSEIVEEGAVPLEEIRKDLTEELLAEEKERIWTETLDEWKEQYKITTYPDRTTI